MTNLSPTMTNQTAGGSAMQLRPGAEVLSHDGSKIGDLVRLVMHPDRPAVTHVVISTGVVFEHEKVVRFHAVAAADADHASLRDDVDPDALADFEETVHAVAQTVGRAHAATGPQVSAGRMPTVAPVANPALPLYPRERERVVRCVPEGVPVVSADATVRALDGDDVGKLAAVTVDERGELTALVVDHGWFRPDWELPGQLVLRVRDELVELAVAAETLGHLEH